MTYSASVMVPSWATCLMSALLKGEESSPDGDTKVFRWEQKVPIPSYLLAMAVGQLARKDISNRCAIWSEPGVVDAAAYEFAQTEDFLRTAERLAGTPYVWGRYDLLCLAPSFPYGGMENPCLTFVTPVSVVFSAVALTRYQSSSTQPFCSCFLTRLCWRETAVSQT